MLSKTQLIKGLILQINEDILQKPTKKLMDDLKKNDACIDLSNYF